MWNDLQELLVKRPTLFAMESEIEMLHGFGAVSF